MYQPSSNSMIVDEIDRLTLAYDKARDYLGRITSGIDQQMNIWAHRRQTIDMETSSSYEFLLPKTQRINELTLEAVEALCRVELLIEQVIRIDPKSINLNRSHETNVGTSRQRYPTSLLNRPPTPRLLPNGKLFDQHVSTGPVQRASSSRLSMSTTEEKTVFKPVVQPQVPAMSESQSRFAPLYRPTSQYAAPSRPALNTRSLNLNRVASPSIPPLMTQMASNYSQASPQQQQPFHSKEKIKLQRIPPGTIWKCARIDIIDSLSGFYVQNLDPNVKDNFDQMIQHLHETYDEWEKSHRLVPLENIAIGDFGVAKYSEDGRWYRARLIMCEGRDEIKIVFIDFGNIEVKSIDEFFPIDQYFTTIPAQAIACSLSGAFPPSQNDEGAIWPSETIQIFRNEVTAKMVEVQFANRELGTEQWPLHFVRIIVNNQHVTTLLNLKQYIDPRPNDFIAEQLAPTLTEREYILFNIPIGEDDLEQ